MVSETASVETEFQSIMKCCRFFVLFVAILLHIEGYDAGLLLSKALQGQTPNDQRPAAESGQPAGTATTTRRPKTKLSWTAPVPEPTQGPSQGPIRAFNLPGQNPLNITFTEPTSSPRAKPLASGASQPGTISGAFDFGSNNGNTAKAKNSGRNKENDEPFPGSPTESSPIKTRGPSTKIRLGENKSPNGQKVPGKSMTSTVTDQSTDGSYKSVPSIIPARSTTPGSTPNQARKIHNIRPPPTKSPVRQPVTPEPSAKPVFNQACIIRKRSAHRISTTETASTKKPKAEEPERIVLERQGNLCKGGYLYDVGYTIKSESTDAKRKFVKVLEVCYDPYRARTIYSYAKILPGQKKDKTGNRRAFIKFGGFHGFDISQVYKKIYQQETIGRILASEELGRETIKTENHDPFFLAKGHLVAKIDVTGANAQRATNTFVNVVPMWQNINDGNWKIIEDTVRKLNKDKDFELEVWTGSIGTLTLKDKNDQEKEIYLYINGNHRKVPVPKFLFKVVYNRAAQSGIVFITVNNPYVAKLTKDLKICPDVCEDNKWFPETLQPKVGTLGLSYCCTIDAFRQATQLFRIEIPKFPTHTLLARP